MHRFFKRKDPEPEVQSIGDLRVEEFDFSQLPADLGLRTPISAYNVNIRDQVRRHICQKFHVNLQAMNSPKKKKFGVSQCSRFNPTWFNKFGDWLNKRKWRLLLVNDSQIGSVNISAHNKEINDVILKNAPKNCKSTSPDIQKVIVSACVNETINVIIRDDGDSLFSILVYESRDVSTKEQISFLQLALIVVAKKNLPIYNLFRVVGDMLNVVGASCKHSDLLREKHSDFMVEALERGEISSGWGHNQETTLQRLGDTRWGHITIL
ncbi:uncharacterized protein [Primulina eburnea]|uniref:uncharacterized protein n=1 Tax=Primulina eburnea TaxID=1245227 RepID=UPI003C6C17F1